MQPSNYKFYVNDTEVHPHYKDLKKKYALENNQKFFRTTIDGKMTLHGTDYKLVSSSSINTRHTFTIKKYDSSTKSFYTYFEGSFNKTDCKFDVAKEICELKIEAKDAYNDILAKYDNTYDLIRLMSAITRLQLTSRPVIQMYEKGSGVITNYIAGTYWEESVNEVIDDDTALLNNYHFAFINASSEIFVTGAAMPMVNDVYYGQDGVFYSRNGVYRFEIVKNMITGPGGQPAWDLTVRYQIVQISNNKIVYWWPEYKIIGASGSDAGHQGDYIMSDTKLQNVDYPNDKPTHTYINHKFYQRFLCNVDSIYETPTYDVPLNDFTSNTYNFKKVIGLVGGTLLSTQKVVVEPTIYGTNDDGLYYTDNFVEPSQGFGKLTPINRSEWTTVSFWVSYNSFTISEIERQARHEYTLKHSYSICDVIKALLKKVAPDIKHEATSEYSQFLYGNNTLPKLPVRLFITPKSNILKGEYDKPAAKAEISLEDIFNMLRDCFRCYWYIDSENKLHIEHINWFMKGGTYSSGQQQVQLDLTTKYDKFNDKYSAFFQGEIEYEKSDLAARYEFSWMDEVTNSFEGVAIDINSDYIEKDKTNSIAISRFSTDIDYMLISPNTFSSDGFALIGALLDTDNKYRVPIGELHLVDEMDKVYTVLAQNHYLSWYYLVLYYMWDMPGGNIEFSGLDASSMTLYVRDIAKCMLNTVSFAYDEELDLNKLIKGNFGNGQINEISINITTNINEVTLAYKPG